jgi:hypothetical protein
MSKAVWDAYHTKVFCDICMDEVNDNNRDGGCLSRKGYKNLEEKFFQRTGDRLVKKQLLDTICVLTFCFKLCY